MLKHPNNRTRVLLQVLARAVARALKQNIVFTEKRASAYDDAQL